MNTRVDTGIWYEEKPLDRGFLYGTLATVLLLGIGIATGGKVLNFLDFRGLLLVLGGTLGATLVHYSINDLGYAWRAFRSVIFTRHFDPEDRIRYLVSVAQLVRAQGILVLENEADLAPDAFLKLALQLTVDGQSPDDIRRILETENRTSNEHATRAVQVFETMGNYSPALGLIGTLIGLIQMLGTLENPATVAPAMAMALVATLYGAVFANLFFLPIAGKLRIRNEENALLKAITSEGAVSLARQESSIVVEQRLRTFLPPIK